MWKHIVYFFDQARGKMALLAKGLNQIPLKCLEATDEGAGFSLPGFPPCWISRLKYAEAHFIVETISF